MTSASGMPQMGRAMMGWTQSITMTRRWDSVVDGLVEHREQVFTFKGVLQPLSDKAIQLKPEGQRAFEWFQLHCIGLLELDVNDQVTYQGQLYKVMAQRDYSLNGFVEYHLIKDYQQ